MSLKTANVLRATYTDVVMEMLAAKGEEVLRVKSNEVAIPVVDAEGNEAFVTFTIKVPSGSREGDEYDGYSMAEEYAMNQKEKADKAAKAEKAKAAKIAKDEARRKAKAEAAQKRKEEEGD